MTVTLDEFVSTVQQILTTPRPKGNGALELFSQTLFFSINDPYYALTPRSPARTAMDGSTQNLASDRSRSRVRQLSSSSYEFNSDHGSVG